MTIDISKLTTRPATLEEKQLVVSLSDRTTQTVVNMIRHLKVSEDPEQSTVVIEGFSSKVDAENFRTGYIKRALDYLRRNDPDWTHDKNSELDNFRYQVRYQTLENQDGTARVIIVRRGE